MEINILQLENKHRKLIRGGQGGFHPQEDLLLSKASGIDGSKAKKTKTSRF
jgi:hypothetical protein